MVFSWSFFIMFVILLAVSLRSVWSLQNISVLFTFVVLFVWIPLHSSSICTVWLVGPSHVLFYRCTSHFHDCICIVENAHIHSLWARYTHWYQSKGQIAMVFFIKYMSNFKKKCDIPADLAAFCTNIHVLLWRCTLIYIKNTYYVIQN